MEIEQHRTERTLVMGILNITPDSFADGGRHFGFEDAITRARAMIDEGVDIIDIGGESTRPGAERISEEEELNRVIPVITELQPLGITLSIDTTRASVARAAIAAGASIVNDVSGGVADKKMASVVAGASHIQYVVMHWRGSSDRMQELAIYEDVVKEVKEELDERCETLMSEGVLAEQIIIDPGLGFAKLPLHNWEILRNIGRLQLLGFPLLIGASRKRFLGELIGATNPDDREAATLAITASMAEVGVWGVRTHAVKAHRDVIAVIEEMK